MTDQERTPPADLDEKQTKYFLTTNEHHKHLPYDPNNFPLNPPLTQEEADTARAILENRLPVDIDPELWTTIENRIQGMLQLQGRVALTLCGTSRLEFPMRADGIDRSRTVRYSTVEMIRR